MLLLTTFISFTSCNKDNHDSDYYIRYEARINKPADGTFQVVFRMPDGQDKTLRLNDCDHFSTVVGPVKYGFTAKIYTNCLGADFKGAYTNISVSKDNSPFALQIFNGGDNYLESWSEYTINY